VRACQVKKFSGVIPGPPFQRGGEGSKREGGIRRNGKERKMKRKGRGGRGKGGRIVKAVAR
jgi:hypothetical protein